MTTQVASRAMGRREPEDEGAVATRRRVFGRQAIADQCRFLPLPQRAEHLPPLSTEQNAALATVPTEELLKIPFLQPEFVQDSLHAYQLSKRGNTKSPPRSTMWRSIVTFGISRGLKSEF